MSIAENREHSGQHGEQRLIESLGQLRKRLLSIGLAAAIGWAMLASVVGILAAIWLDLLWDLPTATRLIAILAAVVVGVGLFAAFAWSLWKRADRRWLASRLDAVGQTGGQISSGLELVPQSFVHSDESVTADSHSLVDQIRCGLATMAVDRAASVMQNIDPAVAIPVRPVKTAMLWLGGVVAGLAVFVVLMPRLASTQWTRFFRPDVDTPPFTALQLVVSPGDIAIKYGSPLEISTTTNMTPVDELQLFVIRGATNEWVPMFDEGGNAWRAMLTRVTEPFQYQVRSGWARSPTYDVDLIRVPEIVDVQFRVTPPAYTRLGPTTLSSHDVISGLRGTRVEVTATSNVPLGGGELRFSGDDPLPTVVLSPLSDDEAKVKGEFELQANTRFDLTLTNREGVASLDSVAGTVSLLIDQQPFIRITQPRPSSWSTATITLPVAIKAEDDFGITSVSLYRSLNGSRPRPIRVTASPGESRKSQVFELPLAEYGLKPGDLLELFARVEDNDPGGMKGAESPVHQVEIISRQQYEEINQRQQGVDSVMNRYREVQRRLESLDQLQKELEAMDELPNEDDQPARQSLRKKLAETADEFDAASDRVKQLLQQRSKIDLDDEHRDRLEELAGRIEDVADEIRKLMKQLDDYELDAKQLKQRLAELREQLEGMRQEFNDQVMQPMEQLVEVFKLMNKQQEFVQLVLRQRNLADRLKSLDGKDDVRDNQAQRRMRELSDEQTTLAKWLTDLLFEIENLASALPLEEEFQQLRDSAITFATKVDASQADELQESAAKSLAEFNGSPGYQDASRAAKILESFVEEAEQAGQQAEGVAENIFKPQHGRPGLGDSWSQLKNMFGPRNGMRQQGASNRGLYGDDPVAQQQRAGGGGDDHRGGVSGFSQSPDQQVGPGNEVQRSVGEAGYSAITVPLQYQRKVSDYYRRLVEDLGE